MNKQRLPKGWDEKRVKDLIAELDSRGDEEWIAPTKRLPRMKVIKPS